MGCHGNDPGTFPALEQSQGSAVLVFLSERCREKREEEKARGGASIVSGMFHTPMASELSTLQALEDV